MQALINETEVLRLPKPPVLTSNSPLAVWRVRRARVSQAILGAWMGVTQVSVSRWERGAALPDLRTAAELERITGGEVRARDLLEWYNQRQKAAK